MPFQALHRQVRALLRSMGHELPDLAELGIPRCDTAQNVIAVVLTQGKESAVQDLCRGGDPFTVYRRPDDVLEAMDRLWD